MNATCISNLVEFLPDEAKEEVIPFTAEPNATGFFDPEAAVFASFYKMTDFGWTYTRLLHKYGLAFPGIVEGSDDWLFKAYLYQLNPKKYGNPTLRKIMSLCSKEMATTRRTLHGLLIVSGMTAEQLAYQVDPAGQTWTPDVIMGYEKLFFNIFDRREDCNYVQQIVYPDTKYVELMEGYMQTEDVGKLLLRAGHNNDLEDILFFAGMSNNVMRRTAAPDLAEKMEAAIMAHGYVMARNGYLNQSGNAAGIYHARSLIQAAKQSGEVGQHDSPLTGIGQSLLADMVRAKTREAHEAIRFMNGADSAPHN